MSNTVIKVENLSKKYIIPHQRPERYTALRDVVANAARRLGNRMLSPFSGSAGSALGGRREEFYALKDVSFEVKQGDRVGIIGRNGAGKSTLLKILSRITEPTSGRIEITGKVRSLLEVGTGFHPELTGRENIYLNGAILGMKKAEIARKFDEIVEFAEVERFLDTPVKHYSSGMHMRLAFAVAAHLEIEILLVDEVLAVGDAGFQKKCLGKMGELSNEGRTVLFVTHNMVALRSLCDRAIWLDAGCIMKHSGAKEVIADYLQSGASNILEQVWDERTAPGNDKARLHVVRMTPQTSNEISEIDVTTPLKMQFEFSVFVRGISALLTMFLYNIEGLCVLNSDSLEFFSNVGRVLCTCFIPVNLLNEGVYRVEIMIIQNLSFPLFTYENALIFEVHEPNRTIPWYGKWPGVVRPTLEWSVSQR